MKGVLFFILSLVYILLINNVNADDNNDANWMSYIPDEKYINQINIPGTHDSGTFNLGSLTNNKITDYLLPGGIPLGQLSEYSQTQNLDIREQLDRGIRFFDIRLALINNESKDLYLCHGSRFLPCIDVKNLTVLYFTHLIKECIYFLMAHDQETIIFHIKEDDIPDKYNKTTGEYEKLDISDLIAKYTILNTDIVPNTEYQYKNFFYTKFEKYPKLGDVRGKIVLSSRLHYSYKDNDVGIQIDIGDNGGCDEYREDGIKCYPILSNKNNTRTQDAYNLNADDKSNLILDVLTNNVNVRYGEYEIKADNIINTKFNSKYNDTTDILVLTVNFLNVARNGNPFRAGINRAADVINKNLINFLNNRERNKKLPLYNEWIVMDFPSKDVIRKIYQSNDLTKEEFKKDKIEIGAIESFYTDAMYTISTIVPFFFKRDGITENQEACLQRKLVIDEQGNQQDLVKTNYKCIENKLNQWRVKSSGKGKFYSIISEYDGKCLNYGNDGLYIQECIL